MSVESGDRNIDQEVSLSDGEIQSSESEYSEAPLANVETVNSIEDPEDVEMKLFLGQLPPSYHELEIRNIMEKYGEVLEASVVYDPVTNEHKGCGFVTFAKKSVAKRVIQELNGKVIPRSNNTFIIKPALNDEQKNLYIGNIPTHVSEADVGHTTKILKGYGFVEYVKVESAKKAIRELNQRFVFPGTTQKICVKPAETPEQKMKKKFQKELTAMRDFYASQVQMSMAMPMQPVLPLANVASPYLANLAVAGYQPFNTADKISPTATNPPPGFMKPNFAQLQHLQNLFHGKAQNTTELFVYHIPPTFTDVDLFQLFSRFGTVLKCQVRLDPQTKKSKGFGFVTFEHPQAAATAIQEMNGFHIGNKRLQIAYNILSCIFTQQVTEPLNLSMTLNIFVNGITGSFGRSLAQELLNRPELNVKLTALVRSIDKARICFDKYEFEKIEFIEGDIHNMDHMRKAPEKNIDVVVHGFNCQRKDWRYQGLHALHNSITLCKERDATMLFPTTTHPLGRPDYVPPAGSIDTITSKTSMDESYPTLNTSYYGKMRKYMEDMVINSGIRSLMIRAGYLYGPHMSDSFFSRYFFLEPLKTGKMKIAKSLTKPFETAYLPDVAFAAVDLLEHHLKDPDFKHETYHYHGSTNTHALIGEIVESVEEFKPNCRVLVMPEFYLSYLKMKYDDASEFLDDKRRSNFHITLCNEKLRNALPYFKKTGLDVSVATTMRALQYKIERDEDSKPPSIFKKFGFA
ncbi:NAD(P)-binding protein [Rozella allomycis CSF55]|uniref:NAD(P)-binding protein n=1 Tax=Rozella allomycis (strain CSF55) TaxID=988480 RepID=A0A4P9YH43_ROZAC|nr:NAD(P)-binding protein [Rozella allomycis CSF55]